MPSKSAKQAKFMRAVSHSPKFAKKVGVPQSVGKDFEMADKRRKLKKFGEGGEAARTAKYTQRYERKVADIESDYQKALKGKTGRDAEVAKAKYEQRMADAADDRAKWIKGDRTQTRAAEKAAERNLRDTRKYGARSSETQVAKAEESLASKAPLSSVDTSSVSKPATKMSFAQKFRMERDRLGPGKTFSWNGKSYSTNMASDSKASVKRTGTSTAKGATPTGLSTTAERSARSNYADVVARSIAARANAPKPAAGSTAPRSAGAAPAAPVKRNIDRFNLDKVRQEMDKPATRSKLFAGEDKLKAAQERAAAAQGKKKGGSVMKYNKGGKAASSPLGSQKDIIDRANRTPYEPIPKTGPDKPKPKLGPAGKKGYKSGGSAMKKSDKAGRALVKKSADTMGRAMKFAKGGSASARADGCAKKGKTKGKMLARGGKCM